MKLDKFQKAKVSLGLSSFALLFAILFVPSVVNSGFSWASEDTLETLLLFLCFLATVYVFWHYDYVVQKREQEAFSLSFKLKSKEKELIETFQYLGKVNVQFSVIRDLMDRMKKPTPNSEEDLRGALKELLGIACNIVGSEKAWLRIIDIKKRKMLLEESAGRSFLRKKEKSKLTVGTLVDMYEGKSMKLDGCEVFYSKSKSFNIKAFLILPPIEDVRLQGADFLRAVVNQCEILFILLNSRYHRINNRKNEKK